MNKRFAIIATIVTAVALVGSNLIHSYVLFHQPKAPKSLR